jgi:hypothetical protein
VTRYLCDDVSHWRDGEPRTVDVTAQVRLELGYVVDREAFAADVREVIARVQQVGSRDRAQRRAAIREILTGTSAPTGAPVRLADGPAGTSSRVIRLPDAVSGAGNGDTGLTRTATRTDTGASLTGTFAADALAGQLADAEPTPAALADAIRRTPPYTARDVDEVGHAWRVVIACPVAEGEPPTEHHVVFAGTGDREPFDVFGIPASSWDLALEATAQTDLAPAHGARRAEHLIGALLLGELLVTVAIVCTTWLTGVLGMAAREAPVWVALAVILAVGAMAFAAIGLFGPRAPEGNVNDTLVVSRFYSSRTQMLWIATAVSIALFAAALAVAFIGPIGADDGALPSAAVSFTSQGGKTSATLDVAAANIGIDEGVRLTAQSFTTATSATGTPIGSVTTTGSPDGTVVLHDVVGVPAGARYLAIVVAVDGASEPGCTVLAVPQAASSTTASTSATSTSTSAATTVVNGVSASPSAQP